MTARRSRAEIADLKAAIYDICKAENPTTVRHVFYALVSRGLIAKTEAEYKQVGVRLTGTMREAGELPWGWLVDATRWMRKPASYDSAEDALRDTAAFYRRSLWSSADAAVQVWAEKDAIASILYDVTRRWDVPLMVARGYSSKGFLYSTAEDIAQTAKVREKNTIIYYFADYDPSGQDAMRATEETLYRYIAKLQSKPDFESIFSDYMLKVIRSVDSPLKLFHAAVTPEQIVDLGLQTRPTKRSDTREAAWRRRQEQAGLPIESVELDAIPSSELRRICEECILPHFNEHELQVLRTAEASEREWLGRLAEAGVGDGS